MLHYNGAVVNVKGEDKRISAELHDNTLLLGVADGHGGETCAIACRSMLPGMIEKATSNKMPIPSDVQIEAIFKELHDRCSQLGCKSGAALTVCVVDKTNGAFKCANVGDAACILCTPTSHMMLTTTHRLQDSPQERRRLHHHIGFGGAPVGPPRLYPGGLACSRSIGDGDCPFVRCTPALCDGTIGQHDVLVIASDGLWDVSVPREVSKVARETRCALAILKKRRQTTYTDDTSVVVVSRQPKVQPVGLFRSSSSASLSSDDDDLPPRTIVGVQL